MKNKRQFLPIIICIILAFFIEIFIFNFRSFQTMSYHKSDLNNIKLGSDIKKKGNKYKIIGNKNNYIEIENINKKVNNLKIDMGSISDGYLIYDIYSIDEGNSFYYKLPVRYYYPFISKSKYINLDLYGKAKNIKIYIRNQSNTNTEFVLNKISMNEKIPIEISWTRLIIMIFLIASLYYFRPNSELYKLKVNFMSKKQLVFAISFIVFFLTFSWYMININEPLKVYGKQHCQYQFLAESLSKGKLYLEKIPPKKLANLDNPYNYIERKQNLIEYEWDTAYYKGKYYVYFGVVPEILTFLPYHIITGKALPNFIAVYLSILLIIIGAFFLEKSVVNKYFKNISFAIFMLVYVWFVFTTGLIEIACYPTLYNIPIAYALMFTIWGLYFWISSMKNNDISKPRLFLGSLCMALVAGCRPQLLLCSFFVFFIFNKEIKNKKLLSKTSKLNTFIAFLPYFLVAIPLMYYNYARFGSPFDFGTNYNLTSNDMPHRGFKIDRIGFGLFTYLLQPVNLIATFPFLNGTTVVNNYMGLTINEPMFGGALLFNPLLLFGLLGQSFLKDQKNKKLQYFSILCIIFALIIVVVDTEVAGILQRYMSDFLFLFAFSTIIVIFSIFNKKIDKNIKKYLIIIILFLLAISIVNSFILIFQDWAFYSMISTNTRFYFKWYYLLQWWL